MIQALASKTAKPSAIDWQGLRQEPYRLLFPLGISLAAVGIGLWIPFYLWPEAVGFPGQAHAVILIQGFLLCFIFGFLGTMMPKVLGVRPLNTPQFAIFPIALVGLAVASLAGAPRLAQILHLCLLANFAVFIALRFPRRTSNPPPAFAFIAVAMLADIAGTLLKLAALSDLLGATASRAGALLQYQAFPLLLILGVGGFLLPKLFANGPIDPASLRDSAASGPGRPLALAALFLISFGVEILSLHRGYGDAGLRAAYGLRAAVWIWFILRDIRIHKVPGKLPLYLFGARVSLIVIGAGLLLPVFRPAYLLAWEHVIFLSGFLRLTLSIASRVVAAHSGRLEILGLHRKKVRVYGMLIVFAMFTRIASDFWPKSHWMHIAIAAAVAMTAIAIWSGIFFPLLRVHPGGKV